MQCRMGRRRAAGYDQLVMFSSRSLGRVSRFLFKKWLASNRNEAKHGSSLLPLRALNRKNLTNFLVLFARCTSNFLLHFVLKRNKMFFASISLQMYGSPSVLLPILCFHSVSLRTFHLASIQMTRTKKSDKHSHCK